MTSAPSKTTTVKTVNNKTGVTKSTSTVTSGNSTTVTKTTTIGTPKTTTAKSSVSTPAALARAALGSRWLVGPNDTRPMCAPVALANTLLAATGTEASNAALERLYRAAGGIGKHAAPLLSVLTAARSDGLAGCRLKAFRRAALDDADVLLLGLGGQPRAGIQDTLHAAAFAGMSVIAWGDEIPLEDMDARIVDAWSLTWHGQEEVTSGR
jgi:hypothetical protein